MPVARWIDECLATMALAFGWTPAERLPARAARSCARARRRTRSGCHSRRRPDGREARSESGCGSSPSRRRVRLEAGGPADLPAGEYAVLSVRDRGEGMDEETLMRAAEPFFTTKGVGKGSGLGLPMVHGLAAQSGGRLLRMWVGMLSSLLMGRRQRPRPDHRPRPHRPPARQELARRPLGRAGREAEGRTALRRLALHGRGRTGRPAPGDAGPGGRRRSLSHRNRPARRKAARPRGACPGAGACRARRPGQPDRGSTLAAMPSDVPFRIKPA